jgi:hypothetical protein
LPLIVTVASAPGVVAAAPEEELVLLLVLAPELLPDEPAPLTATDV